MRRTETPKPIWIKVCVVVDIPDVVTYTNFGDHRLRGFWVAGGVKFPLSHRLSSSPLQHSRTTVRACDADDILLLSASVVTLQSMLSICSEHGRKYDIIFNCKKSMCMAVASKWKTAISPMLLDDVPFPWVKSIKYLGIVLVAGISLHVDCGYIKKNSMHRATLILPRVKMQTNL